MRRRFSIPERCCGPARDPVAITGDAFEAASLSARATVTVDTRPPLCAQAIAHDWNRSRIQFNGRSS